MGAFFPMEQHATFWMIVLGVLMGMLKNLRAERHDDERRGE
jgi:hypothetical protein